MGYYKKSTEKEYYKILKHPESANSLVIKKFNPDLELQSEYTMNYYESANGGYYDCNCPASKFDCRHKTILKEIKDRGKIGAGEFYCFQTKTFHSPEGIS